MITEKSTKQEIWEAYQDLEAKVKNLQSEELTALKLAEAIKLMPDEEAYQLYLLHHSDIELYNRLNGGVK